MASNSPWVARLTTDSAQLSYWYVICDVTSWLKCYFRRFIALCRTSNVTCRSFVFCFADKWTSRFKRIIEYSSSYSASTQVISYSVGTVLIKMPKIDDKCQRWLFYDKSSRRSSYWTCFDIVLTTVYDRMLWDLSRRRAALYSYGFMAADGNVLGECSDRVCAGRVNMKSCRLLLTTCHTSAATALFAHGSSRSLQPKFQ